jgi:hypothetical protein
MRHRRECSPQLLVDDRRFEQRLFLSAVGLGHQDPDQAEFGELLPQIVGIALLVVLEGANDLEW